MQKSKSLIAGRNAANRIWFSRWLRIYRHKDRMELLSPDETARAHYQQHTCRKVITGLLLLLLLLF